MLKKFVALRARCDRDMREMRVLGVFDSVFVFDLLVLF